MRAVLVLAAVALAACGQPAAGPRLSEDEFLGQARLICADLAQRAQLADASLSAAALLDRAEGMADARRVVSGFAPVVADARSAFAELRPPDARRVAAEAYLDALGRARSRLVTAGASDGATRRFLAGGGRLLTGLDAEEAAMGLKGCAGPSPAEADAEADSSTMESLRTALVTEQVILAGDEAFSERAEDFELLQSGGSYVVGLIPPSQPAAISVKVANDGAVVFLGARSRSGTCFYVVARADGPTGYARDTECRSADAQDFTEAW
ncbi:MAG: hypothetical protein ACRD1K_21440 [Acidimicrobiales bacterium]